MRKILVIAIVVLFLGIPRAFAQESIRIDITPQPCANRAGCPIDLIPAYADRGESCVTDINEFAARPTHNHYWVEDPKITDQGKADERARQFIYWTLSTRSLDDSPVLKNVWRLTSNITYFLVLFVAAMLGIGLIVGQRLRFETKVKVWPTVIKIISILIYVTFSASIIILLIQLSEILMKFFLETLGGKDFFNIYFSTDQKEQINQQGAGTGPIGGAATGSSESNYIGFIGCRDLNIRVQESVHAEVFLFKATNITYYVMGVMILLRKILLWWLLFVSPFAAILIPFSYIRNVAWIWLGVFFQWLFYGPLFALFLGAIATIWKQGIPFLFDFSRVDNMVGYVYPTAINITYGGPAQHLSALNNGNYVDTFAEYVITLIMLWAAIVFPWWLLRIFRDYCCGYLMAMKNILLNMYDQMRLSPGPLGPSPTLPSPSTSRTSTSQNIVNKTYTQGPTEQKLETIEQIRNTTTQNILKNVSVSAPKLVDIAKFETNKSVQQVANKNIEYLKNPMKADTPAERQKYMNIRTELLNRALKEDKLAKQVLSSVSTSFVDQRENKSAISNQVYNAMSKTVDNSQAVRENIARNVVAKVTNQQFDQVVKQSNATKESVVKTVLENTPAQHSIASVVQVPQQTVNNVSNTITNSISNQATINQIAQNSKVDNQSVQQIYDTYQQNSTQSPTQVFQTIANNQSVSNSLQKSLSTSNETVNQVSSQTNVSTSDVHKIVQEMTNLSQAPAQVSERTIIQNIARETNTEREKVQTVVEQIKTRERQGEIKQDTITNISNQTNVPTSTVQTIVNKWNENKAVSAPVSETTIIEHISRETQTEREKVREVVSQIRTHEKEGAIGSSTINSISSTTGVPVATVQNIVTKWIENKNPETRAVNIISQKTQIEKERVKTVMDQMTAIKNEKVKEVLNQIRDTAQQTQTATNIITQVSQTTQVSKPAIEQILQTWNQNISQNPTQIINAITNDNKVSTSLNNTISNNNEVINSISNQTGVEGPNIKNISNVWNQAISQVTTTAPGIAERYVVEKVSHENQISKEKVREVITQISTRERERAVGETGTGTGAGLNATTINSISSTSGVPVATVQNVISTLQEAKSITTARESETHFVERISTETRVEKEKVQEVLTQIKTHEKEGVIGGDTITNISNTSGVPVATVQKIAQYRSESVIQAPSTNITEKYVVEKISHETQIEKEKIREIMTQISTHEKEASVGDTTTINNISSTAGVPVATVQNIINTWNEAKAPPAGKISETQLIEHIATETHVEKEKVREVVKQMTELKKEKVREVVRNVHDQVSKDKTLVRQIAKQHNIKEEEVQKIADAQRAIVSAPIPSQEVEKKIALPSTVSIEDYEAVKQMWQKQYETGEIPVQENIQSRQEWVEHDTIFITNALNKLTSEDEEVRQQGLDDIGYILPIFMINNFKGEEMLVYLKAKLQAAKAVQAQLEREEEIKSDLEQKDEEEKVELSGKKKEEEEKTMEIEQAMTIDGEEKKPGEEGNGGGTNENGQGGGTPPAQ